MKWAGCIGSNCDAARADGIVCADDCCDIEAGIRPPPLAGNLCGSAVAHLNCKYAGEKTSDPERPKIRCAATTADHLACPYRDALNHHHRVWHRALLEMKGAHASA